QNLNPERKARKRIFLSESSKKSERDQLKSTLQLWAAILSSSDNVMEMVESCEQSAKTAEETLTKNLAKAVESTKDLEKSYRTIALFFSFIRDYGLSAYDAGALTSSRELADYFETVATGCGAPKLAANWVMGDFSAALNRSEAGVAESPVSARALAQLLSRIQDETISGKIAKEVFDAMWAGEGEVDGIIEARGLKQITDTGAIDAIIDEVIAANPSQLEQYRSGKDKLFGFFVGQVMKKTQGKANPAQVNERLRARLQGD
ncbi:MAG: hypothetical protein R6U12_08760, partial [Thioalkalivibrio sp.]